MHVAAMKPAGRSRRKTSTRRPSPRNAKSSPSGSQRRQAGNIMAKMVEGRMKNFYADKVLLEQPFVKDDKKTVGQVAKEAGDEGQAVRAVGVGQVVTSSAS